MTNRLISRPAILAMMAVLVMVAPLSAAGRRRAASMPKTTTSAKLTGQVLDAATGAPVMKAQVNASGKTVVTDANGRFTLEIPAGRSVALIITRTGYQTLTTSLTLAADTTQTFTITPTPTVTVRTKSGTTYQLDGETVEFGYLAPFSGFSKDTKMNLCKPGGETFQPDRSEIRKVSPGVQLNDAACCSRGAVASVDLEMKSGQKVNAALTDACFGYQVDVIGLRHDTAEPVNLHLADLIDIVFP